MKRYEEILKEELEKDDSSVTTKRANIRAYHRVFKGYLRGTRDNILSLKSHILKVERPMDSYSDLLNMWLGSTDKTIEFVDKLAILSEKENEDG